MFVWTEASRPGCKSTACLAPVGSPTGAAWTNWNIDQTHSADPNTQQSPIKPLNSFLCFAAGELASYWCTASCAGSMRLSSSRVRKHDRNLQHFQHVPLQTRGLLCYIVHHLALYCEGISGATKNQQTWLPDVGPNEATALACQNRPSSSIQQISVQISIGFQAS